MANYKLRRKDLKKLGYPNGRATAMAINMMLKHYKRTPKEDVLELLKRVYDNPQDFLEDEVLGRIAEELIEKVPPAAKKYSLNEEMVYYKTYGAKGIEEGAREQMDAAMKLPITLAGALMADAHHGYGLPIGGVLATENAVIPYGVGVDIGCRMCLSIYDLPPKFIGRENYKLTGFLKEHTKFGLRAFKKPLPDPIFERSEFKEIPFVSNLKNKAYSQIGSSGSGNHFVEFGIVNITDPDNEFNLPVGEYVGLLSHSGSRGLGANIAKHYTQLAREKCHLPKIAKHLAWLDLNSEEGQEYWLAMNLAGDYASACHDHIHRRMQMALGEAPIAKVENHHNFAWKETLEDGREVIVHRKGATPAGKGVLGIIPGSMTAEGFIVRGKGNTTSLNSASHGAGRVMSRTRAKNSITTHQLKKVLRDHGVELIGGGLDEAPMAYKDIHQVMAAQADLVEVVGTFLPKIVRMDK